VVDIYDMGDTLNAFGIYSAEKSPGGKYVKIGAEGLMTDNTLYFWQNKYYVKLMAYEISDRTSSKLRHLAGIIKRKLPHEGSRPFLFTIFPESGRLSGTERYIARDVLGQNYFTHGYSVTYSSNGKEYKIYLIQGESSEITARNFNSYRKFYGDSGQLRPGFRTVGDESFAGKESYYGDIFFARRGNYIIGILGLPDKNLAQSIIEEMFARLSN